MQRFYFSGLAGKVETQWLRQIDVGSVLVDPADFGNRQGFRQVALDSGAYRAFKAGQILHTDQWYEDIAALGGDVLNALDFIVMPDVLGDPDATFIRWRSIRCDCGLMSVDHSTYGWIHKIVPVWQWGAPRRHLEGMMAESPLVCVGGLVPAMRAKDEAMLKALTEVCEMHGPSLHLLGLNWLKAFQALAPLIHSADTSKWLDGARYGHAIFVNTRTGQLVQAPARAIPQYAELSREGRCTLAAETLLAVALGESRYTPIRENEREDCDETV